MPNSVRAIIIIGKLTYLYAPIKNKVLAAKAKH